MLQKQQTINVTVIFPKPGIRFNAHDLDKIQSIGNDFIMTGTSHNRRHSSR